MFARIDLHTHSRYSDGALTPRELVTQAATRRVEMLALTDHDTTAGCAEAAAACTEHGIRFVPGIELTCGWRGREIHVVGLSIDPSEAALAAHCAALQQRRRERLLAIAARLTRAGLPGDALVQAGLAATTPTRRHVAEALRDQGYADSVQQAFDRYLARGCPGHAPVEWPTLGDCVAAIRGAGGRAVLAHPHRYKLSAGALRELLGEFKDFGGLGLEVSLAGMGPNDADRLARLARQFELAASIGSDFHEPGLPWRPLGRFAKLPDRLVPIMAHL